MVKMPTHMLIIQSKHMFCMFRCFTAGQMLLPHRQNCSETWVYIMNTFKYICQMCVRVKYEGLPSRFHLVYKRTPDTHQKLILQCSIGGGGWKVGRGGGVKLAVCALWNMWNLTTVTVMQTHELWMSEVWLPARHTQTHKHDHTVPRAEN